MMPTAHPNSRAHVQHCGSPARFHLASVQKLTTKFRVFDPLPFGLRQHELLTVILNRTAGAATWRIANEVFH